MGESLDRCRNFFLRAPQRGLCAKTFKQLVDARQPARSGCRLRRTGLGSLEEHAKQAHHAGDQERNAASDVRIENEIGIDRQKTSGTTSVRIFAN
jgi:hypothetical protein